MMNIKQLFFSCLAIFSLLFISCTKNLSAYALMDKMYFDAKGGIQETLIGTRDKSPVGEDSFGTPYVELYDEEKGEIEEDTQFYKPPVLLHSGEYEMDYGWVKFYYPKTKHKIRVEVAPNQTGKNRKAEFYAPSHVDLLVIKIFQSAQ